MIQKYFSTNYSGNFSIPEKSKLNYLALISDSHIELNFDFTGKEWNIFLICFWKGNTTCKIKTSVNSSDSNVNIFILSFLQDDNYINVDWDISMSKGISNSKWHLLEKNIILWKKIKVKASPRLDVYSQNVQSTHGVSIDKLDKEKMFYIMSRGLSNHETMELIIHSYIQYILDFFQVVQEPEKMEIEQKILLSIKIDD